jgi:hypothetical protein
VTDVNGADATLADRIAPRGREALVERLRKAYADAAASHSDIVSLDDARIEALVQSAADRADGLQWRRALANVASEELGVSLAEALTHPAVREAQEQLGAPSYEASLAELVARPVPPPTPPEPIAPALEPVEHLEAVSADETYVELLPEPEPIEYETGSYESVPDEVEEAAPPVLEQVPYEPEVDEQAAEPALAVESTVAVAAAESAAEVAAAEEYVGEPTRAHPAPAAVEESYGETYGSEHTDYPPPEDGTLQVLAYHLGGVANLPTGRDGLDLRISESGLDILQPEGEIIGRLHWNEIDSLEVIAVRGRLRRQARTLSRIVVRTKHGDASFEVPGLSSEDLEARVEPLISRYVSA